MWNLKVHFRIQKVFPIMTINVSCTYGKISVRIKLKLPSSLPSNSIVVFFPVGLSSLSQHSQQVLLAVEVSSDFWLGNLSEEGNSNFILTEISILTRFNPVLHIDTSFFKDLFYHLHLGLRRGHFPAAVHVKIC